jgi:hypothetical protein
MSDRKLRRFVRAWVRRYPYPVDWMDDRANKQCRRSMDQWLAQFAGATNLKKREFLSVVSWRLRGNRELLEKTLVSMEGPAQTGRARRAIKKALATSNPTRALDHLVGEEGAPGWGPEIASAILAACRPETYVIFDERILRTLNALGVYSTDSAAFDRNDWLPYLHACRRLAKKAGVSLSGVGQALWAAADDAPNLPAKRKVRRDHV